MKKKIFIFITFITIIIIVAILNIDNINSWRFEYRIRKYGQPINIETGLINNEFFGISSNNSNSTKTREGINEAINYASENNIEYIKLEKGTYLIDSSLLYQGYRRSILLKSNLTFDLNGSTIILEENSYSSYGVISIWNCENVVICNGTLIGDRELHNYIGSTTHEWGMGIDIRGSKNIKITKNDW